MFQVTDYLEAAICVGCDKPDKECLVIATKEYSGPHCLKCVQREAKKRKPKTKESHAPLFEKAS